MIKGINWLDIESLIIVIINQYVGFITHFHAK